MSDSILDFCIVGLPKCATTWTCHNLYSHPDVAIPRKEGRYYDSGKNYDDYDDFKQFIHAESNTENPDVIGEKSPQYATNHGVLKRLAQCEGSDTKIILQVRAETDRIQSVMKYQYEYNDVPRDTHFHEFGLDRKGRWVEDGIVNESTINKETSTTGYLHNLFDEVLVLEFNTIKTKPRTAMDRVCQFLGINSEPGFNSLGYKVNSLGDGPEWTQKDQLEYERIRETIKGGRF